ncbi:hypothetical protein [Fusobacterium polymorphum]|uniref:hypothetical protein n=1 Tax=Fusobacterium nucleatum subsp. polymorphum TaxID=76857 RepID=UPI0030081E1E
MKLYFCCTPSSRTIPKDFPVSIKILIPPPFSSTISPLSIASIKIFSILSI